MAGDYDTAKAYLRKYVNQRRFCVTISRTDFIYPGGLEEGIKVRLVNYPRFPSSRDAIDDKTYELAKGLMEELGQLTSLLISPEFTV